MYDDDEFYVSFLLMFSISFFSFRLLCRFLHIFIVLDSLFVFMHFSFQVSSHFLCFLFSSHHSLSHYLPHHYLSYQNDTIHGLFVADSGRTLHFSSSHSAVLPNLIHSVCFVLFSLYGLIYCLLICKQDAQASAGN